MELLELGGEKGEVAWVAHTINVAYKGEIWRNWSDLIVIVGFGSLEVDVRDDLNFHDVKVFVVVLRTRSRCSRLQLRLLLLVSIFVSVIK